MESPEISFTPREIKDRERKEGKKRAEITVELDELFRRMEKESDPDIRGSIAGQIRGLLRRGRRVFERLKREGKDELEEYRRHLEELEKVSS